MAGDVVNINLCSPLKLRRGLTGNYHAICHYSYNLPLFYKMARYPPEWWPSMDQSYNSNAPFYFGSFMALLASFLMIIFVVIDKSNKRKYLLYINIYLLFLRG